jgi:hypothetical protein
MSDGTVQFWSIRPSWKYSFELLATWNLPYDLQNGTAYHIQHIELVSRPYPTVSWYMSKGNRIWRFECGPSTVCARTSPDVIVPGVNASLPIQAISRLDSYGVDVGRSVAVSTDYAAILTEHDTYIGLQDVFSWASKTFRQNFPVNHVVGLVASDASDLLIALSPDNPTDVGYVISLKYIKGHFNYSHVTMMQRSTRTFTSWSSDFDPTPIYYWLEQLPYNGTSTNNAFLKSQGLAFNPNTAGAVFAPSEEWSNFITIDTMTKTGLLVSGTKNQPGFTAWAPQFGFGSACPEVVLRPRSIIPPAKGFSAPEFGTYTKYHTRYASAVSKNLLDNRYYLVVLDWTQTPIPPWCPGLNTGTQLSVNDEESQKTQITRLREVEIKANCRISECKLDEATSDCPESHCWGLGGVGGFFCCDHAPT